MCIPFLTNRSKNATKVVKYLEYFVLNLYLYELIFFNYFA